MKTIVVGESRARCVPRAGVCSTHSWSLRIGATALSVLAACSAGGKGGAASPSDTTLFTLGSGSTNSNPTAGGRVVAELELDAPAATSFVLRGTLPVPQGTFPRPDGHLPLAIRDVSGFVVPTQVEIVSRYPVDADGADVVEVLARVQRPGTAVVGQKISYQVVEYVHPGSKLPIKKDVLKLLTDSDSVMLVARDCFDHSYKLDLFTGVRDSAAAPHVQTLRHGPGAVQLRTYGVLKSNDPVGAPSGALPHLFGAHAYVTAWALEDYVSLDVRINNGASGLDKSAGATDDDPLGQAYFRDLELWVKSGWQVRSDVSDPCLGTARAQGAWTAYPLVAPNADGTLHVMPSQAMFHRRLAISKSSAVNLARAQLDQSFLGFCRRGPSPDGGQLYSWWNPQTARYFPQKHALPDLSYLGAATIQSKELALYNQVTGHLQQGTSGGFPISSTALGWAHPWGVKYGGMTGGSEVMYYDGIKTAEVGSRQGYRAYEMTHRMYCERQPQVLYNADGETTRIDQWLQPGAGFQYFNATFFQKLLNNSNDPFGMNVSPAFQRNWVASNGVQPAYEADLLGYSPIDFQHYVRFLHSPMVLAWLGNDALAKDDIRMAAEIFRLSYNEHRNSPGGTIIASGLRFDLNGVQSAPGVGFAFGRGESWGTMSALAAYGLSDLAWRGRWTDWFGKVADVVAAGQSSCNGFVQSCVGIKTLGGQWKARTSIEQAIIENMLWSLKESVFRGADNARFAQTEQTLVDSCYAMIGPMAWDNVGHGPWSHLAVAPLSNALPPYCGSIPAGGGGNGLDCYMTPSSFAYGFELTGDPTFLNKAAEALAGGSPNLLNALRGQGFTNLENKAALLACLQ